MSNFHIEHIKAKNFRVLRNFEAKGLNPLSVFVGPNGSGKSTVMDVLSFLSDCFNDGLRPAWIQRGRGKDLKSREGKGPILIEIGYRELPHQELTTYHLEVDEKKGQPIVTREYLRQEQNTFLDSDEDQYQVVAGDLAANAFGLLANHPRIVALHRFIRGWHISSFSSEGARKFQEAVAHEHLNKAGDNLANVILHLSENHPESMKEIVEKLRQRIPEIERVYAEPTPDGLLKLQIKDVAFSEPFMSRFTSEGTLSLLSLLVLLNHPEKASLIGIEYPEKSLHPGSLYRLAKDFQSEANPQIFATTHSPDFLNALNPEHVHVLSRNESGYTKCMPLTNSKTAMSVISAGVPLGDIWGEGFFRTIRTEKSLPNKTGEPSMQM